MVVIQGWLEVRVRVRVNRGSVTTRVIHNYKGMARGYDGALAAVNRLWANLWVGVEVGADVRVWEERGTGQRTGTQDGREDGRVDGDVDRVKGREGGGNGEVEETGKEGRGGVPRPRRMDPCTLRSQTVEEQMGSSEGSGENLVYQVKGWG